MFLYDGQHALERFKHMDRHPKLCAGDVCVAHLVVNKEHLVPCDPCVIHRDGEGLGVRLGKPNHR